MYQICCVLTAKFKNYFPICEGNVISLVADELKTTICENDGLKEMMKLMIYEDHEQRDDFAIIGEAKVNTVYRTYSLATPLSEMNSYDKDAGKITNWKVITR